MLFSGIQLLLLLLTGIAFVKNALTTLLVILCHSVTIHLNHKCKSSNSKSHIVWKSPKMSHLSFLGFFVLPCNTIRLQTSGFQTIANLTIFGIEWDFFFDFPTPWLIFGKHLLMFKILPDLSRKLNLWRRKTTSWSEKILSLVGIVSANSTRFVSSTTTPFGKEALFVITVINGAEPRK